MAYKMVDKKRLHSTLSVAPVVEDCHQCLLWLIPAIDKFPRQRRFTLGEKLETAMLNVLTIRSWIGHAMHAETLGLRKHILNTSFKR